jgi:hypothetical protein
MVIVPILSWLQSFPNTLMVTICCSILSGNNLLPHTCWLQSVAPYFSGCSRLPHTLMVTIHHPLLPGNNLLPHTVMVTICAYTS